MEKIEDRLKEIDSIIQAGESWPALPKRELEALGMLIFLRKLVEAYRNVAIENGTYEYESEKKMTMKRIDKEAEAELSRIAAEKEKKA